MKKSECGVAPILGAARERRVLIVHNPIAGWRRSARVAKVQRALGALGCTVSIRATEFAGHAEQIVRQLPAGAFDVLAVSGGDGTINEVLNGLGPDSPVLGVIPNGTANVLANEIDLPSSPVRIARLIAAGRPSPIFPGMANGRRFAMMAGAGYDAHVVAAVTPGLKKRLGKAAYVWRSLTLMRGFDYRGYDLRIDGRATKAASVIVTTGRYYAGRHLCAPAGQIDRPDLQVCIFERGGAFNVLRYGAALVTNRLPRLPDFTATSASEIEISGHAGEPVQTDGDVAGVLPVRISAARDPIWILRPRSPT